MSTSCLEKQQKIIQEFSGLTTSQAKYERIMQMGREGKILADEYKIEANLVSGCQSQMYLHSRLENGTLSFTAASDALISAGLAQLLIFVYQGESAETVLTCPPDYLKVLGLDAALSPSRSNGLYSIHLKMKQDALKHLLKL